MKNYDAQLGFKINSRDRSRFKHMCEMNDTNMETVLNIFIHECLKEQKLKIEMFSKN